MPAQVTSTKTESHLRSFPLGKASRGEFVIIIVSDKLGIVLDDTEHGMERIKVLVFYPGHTTIERLDWTTKVTYPNTINVTWEERS